MKKICLTMFILLPLSLQANPPLNIKIGGNFTHIDVANCSEQAGISLGIYREWHIWRSFFLDGEVMFTSKRAVIKNKRIHFYPGCIYTYDIHCSYGFIELPILLKFYVPTTGNIKFQFHAGPSISLGMIDNSSKEERSEGYSVSPMEYDESKSYQYDYGEIFDPGLLWPYKVFNSFLGLNFGVGINLSYYKFEIRYHRSTIWSAYTDSSLLELEENYYTIHFLLSVPF